ncbi:MAG: pyruvate, phosphate dikinase [Clostridiales bacterium]|jgi:pyruvate,orthophosphate dikinase|nr:pyruvate, phosphate dikinase [Clostridiales bacterium]
MFNEGNASMKNLLGGKGANLAEMTKLGLPIPFGFTISTEACTFYNLNNKKISEEMKNQIFEAINNIERQTGKVFGSSDNPLLVSVRSGARISMPGMMDTVLNLGLNDDSVKALAKLTKNERFAFDCYRRFIMMFGDVVTGISKSKFEKKLDEFKESKNYKNDLDLSADDLKFICSEFKKIYKQNCEKDFPDNAKEQLFDAVCAVFNSWDNPRAFVYRRMNDIPYEWGTAVNVQSMVFGNMGENSGTGVVFTRNPSTGENKIYGEYMINAQGEDVVAGVRTPKPFDELKKEMSNIYEEFMDLANKLENHYKDMQDMEITIENGKLYFLQTRNGKRTANAALRIAVEMVEEGLIKKEEAIMKVDPRQLDQLLHPMFDNKILKSITPIGKALPASPGAATGKVYFNAEDAKKAGNDGEKVILVRLETSPEDIEGMFAAQGILTVRGGMTSHAAVVARGMGRCCVSGCEDIKIDEKNKNFSLNNNVICEGDYISLDGSTGYIYSQEIKTVEPVISGNFSKFMQWADEFKILEIRANADTPQDVLKAIEFGAEGIGLTRTEHMFFEEDRIKKVRMMILSDNEKERRKALNEIMPLQKNDFKEIYRIAGEKPVTIRLLDPPLHEFLPKEDIYFQELAEDMKKSVNELKLKASSLHEINPMMGHRGCRLAVSYPEIAEMQTRAILEAAIEIKRELNINIEPEIMIPLVVDLKEFNFVKKIIDDTAKIIFDEHDESLIYRVGTMIEVPRAALLSNEIAREAEFFSFGTNDLTQLTFGLSRDDAGKILDDYINKNIFEYDPTARLDKNGVGELIKISVKNGKSARNDIKIGICGEHGGDPSSIEFCHEIGLNYVSCSPFRVPIARLSAAQSYLKQKDIK